ncbi:iron chaperone [Cohaesibacter gelatinilyticus]|uniref:YdhG-like domain-containing protein n=1 Tax=Cohaesibacter gelatinilyticus TaxID=372072 RepID=A0A285PER0_9HYPH|nr:DUF1801 domain-containing protein [Cohaesibacter gelatinilyticus]SNZ19928.1 protein of unknown function (DU1801) [Cohaesibacter gelatinilyticus]HAT87339.1 DUF1801 domain-containing protein [Hyphomicrobiales bacterium]
MQSDADTPQRYLDQLEEDWRKDKLLTLRQLILGIAPEVDEHIHYKMLGYGLDDRWLCHLNAQKQYVSLYLGNIQALDPDGSLTTGLNIGKGCVRLSKSLKITDTGIPDLIQRSVARWKKGEVSGC